jgi:hypothetical protein
MLPAPVKSVSVVEPDVGDRRYRICSQVRIEKELQADVE